jgi:hypothetical protein
MIGPEWTSRDFAKLREAAIDNFVVAPPGHPSEVDVDVLVGFLETAAKRLDRLERVSRVLIELYFGEIGEL